MAPSQHPWLDWQDMDIRMSTFIHYGGWSHHESFLPGDIPNQRCLAEEACARLWDTWLVEIAWDSISTERNKKWAQMRIWIKVALKNGHISLSVEADASFWLVLCNFWGSKGVTQFFSSLIVPSPKDMVQLLGCKLAWTACRQLASWVLLKCVIFLEP